MSKVVVASCDKVRCSVLQEELVTVVFICIGSSRRRLRRGGRQRGRLRSRGCRPRSRGTRRSTLPTRLPSCTAERRTKSTGETDQHCQRRCIPDLRTG